jgi:hypothetical protein
MRVPIEMLGARTSDQHTSQLNKDVFAKKITQRDLILRTYHYYKSYDFPEFMFGMTDEEVGMRTKVGTSSMFDLRVCYWKRCSELRKLGLIEPTGETRVSSAGQKQQVCRITQTGVNHVNKTFYE